jgi:hypothetical protein
VEAFDGGLRRVTGVEAAGVRAIPVVARTEELLAGVAGVGDGAGLLDVAGSGLDDTVDMA